jgi:hypothetical protein
MLNVVTLYNALLRVNKDVHCVFVNNEVCRNFHALVTNRPSVESILIVSRVDTLEIHKLGTLAEKTKFLKNDGLTYPPTARAKR